MTPEESLALARECQREAYRMAEDDVTTFRDYGIQSALLAIERMEERVRAETERLRNPKQEMWSGLARQLMMAFDMNAKTPREILEHLDRVGYEIPDWLKDEPEMKALDHVVSKGTRVVLIWKAMFDAAIKETSHEG